MKGGVIAVVVLVLAAALRERRHDELATGGYTWSQLRRPQLQNAPPEAALQLQHAGAHAAGDRIFLDRRRPTPAGRRRKLAALHPRLPPNVSGGATPHLALEHGAPCAVAAFRRGQLRAGWRSAAKGHYTFRHR